MKPNKSKIKVILALLTVAIAVTTTTVFLRPPNESPKEGRIRVAYAPVVLNLPAYHAQESGIFAAKTLKVDFKVFGSANDMINAVVAGQVDAVTGVSLVPILNLEKQYPGRARVVLHSKMTDASPFDGIVVKSQSSIQKLSDLEGKKVGIFPGTTAHNLMMALFKKHGVDTSKVELVQLPPSSHLAALESGSIEALLAYEPTLSTALDGGNRRIFGSIYADLLTPNPISVTIISRKFERDHPEQAAAFISSLDESIQAIRKSPENTRSALAAFTKIPPSVLQKVNIVDDSLSSEVSTENLQSFIELMVRIGELPSPIDANQLVR